MGQTCGIPGDPERERRALKGFSRASETQTHRSATLRVTLFWGACTVSCGSYVMIRVQGKVLKLSFRGVREEEEKMPLEPGCGREQGPVRALAGGVGGCGLQGTAEAGRDRATEILLGCTKDVGIHSGSCGEPGILENAS